MDQVQPVEVSLPARSEVAFLSRTICSSSTIKWILPARLRSPSRNDIVFIGDNSIQLREFVTTSEAHLVDVTAKFTFRSLILAAGVISAPTEVEKVDVLEQIVNQTVEKEQYVIGGKPLPDDYPAQILVLTLASCELVFVYVQTVPNGGCTFQWARRPVLTGCDLPDRFCKTLAIDPESRALAFAPSTGCVGIACLNSFERVKSAIDDWQPTRPQSFLPWTEQRFIQVDGHVIKMDFLKSAEEPQKVLLLLLVVNAGTTSILLYRWDTCMPLHHIKSMGCSGQALASEDRLPLMLIPCGGLASFFLVTETELVLYGEATASKLNRTPYPLPAETTKEHNLPPRPLLWSQWAKPSRYQDYRKTNEDIMLVREDGLLQYFMIQHKPKTRARSSTSAGHLKFDVNTAICMIPVPPDIGGGDILIVGGSMCTGGVFHLPPREAPVSIQSLPNWAPFRDLLLLKSATPTSPSHQSERRLITCTGNKDGQGSVAVINYGLEAQVGWSMEHSDSASIEKIWTIEDEAQNTLLILFSHMMHTSLVLYKIETTEFEYTDAGSYPGLELNTSTLSAAQLNDDVLVQITNSSINIFSFSGQFEPVMRNLTTPGLLCAEIVTTLGIVICAYPTTSSGYSLGTIDLRKGTLDHDIFTTAREVDAQPISLHPANFNGWHLVFASTKDGNIKAYRIGDDLTLTPLFEFEISEILGAAEDVKVSSMCLLTNPSNPIGLLLCGLRSGYLVAIEIEAEEKSLLTTHVSIGDKHVYRIGCTAVVLSPDNAANGTGSPTAAFAMCRNVVRHICLNNNAAGADFSITTVFFVERGAPSKASPAINASCRVQKLQSDPMNDICNLLISATPKNILFSSLVPQPSGVVQTNPVPGIPKNAIQSTFLNQLLVGTDHLTGPAITFMEASADDNSSNEAMYRICQSIKVGDPNERICKMIAFRPTDGSRHFEYLVVALNAITKDSRSQAQTTTGRLVCLSLMRIKKLGSGETANTKPHLIFRTQGKAITALAISGESDLLVGTEKQLKLFAFDVKARQWSEPSTFDLPSPIAAIDVNLGGGKILVATKKHSWMVFKINQEKHLVLLESDRQARNLVSIQSFLGKRAIVTSLSEKGTTIMCMREDVEQGGQMRAVCTAIVPLFLEKVVEETEGLVTIKQGRQRSSFVGCSTDGTLYRFLMLRKEEWDLLNFLQGLYEEKKGSISGGASASKVTSSSKYATVALRQKQVTSARKTKPATCSHIDGDALADLLGEGVMSLRNLLHEQKTVKIEPDMLKEATGKKEQRAPSREEKEIAAKMAGLKKLLIPLVRVDSRDDGDVVGKAIIWLRRVLNWEPA